jgi:hypothetical protein
MCLQASHVLFAKVFKEEMNYHLKIKVENQPINKALLYGVKSWINELICLFCFKGL